VTKAIGKDYAGFLWKRSTGVLPRCFRFLFREGFSSGLIRMLWGSDSSMFVVYDQ